ncbi:MAG TPA: hypothetical protein VF785_17695, partial [Gemmatimonadaceae bacterium]
MIKLSGGAKYLVVPQFATGSPNAGVADVPVAYQIGVTTTSSTSLAAGSLVPTTVASPFQGSAPLPLQQQLDDALRESARREVLSGSWHSAAIPAVGARKNVTAALPDVGSLRDFRVIFGALGSFSSSTVSARLDYVGANLLLYVDTLAPANGFTSAQLQAFGQYFDQTLYQIDVAAFGAPADVDGNGRVIMLLSPSVNRL